MPLCVGEKLGPYEILGPGAAIDHTQGFLVTWTGGNSGTDVIIGGTGASVLAGGSGFTCRVAVEAGQFTVPSYILLGMPAGSGGVSVQNRSSGTLTAMGLDQGVSAGGIYFNVPASFQ